MELSPQPEQAAKALLQSQKKNTLIEIIFKISLLLAFRETSRRIIKQLGYVQNHQLSRLLAEHAATQWKLMGQKTKRKVI